MSELDDAAVAVVGMAGRFPGARNVEELWRLLRDGEEAIRCLSEEELEERGIDPALAADPGHVRAVAELDDAAAFDAAFFGFSPREAEILDPQQRVFLECAWQALEDAGYAPTRVPGTVGLFAGATASTYLLFHLLPNAGSFDPLELLVANAGDSLATRVAYRLNLRGPTFTVQCACSTSLVAVHLACESLLDEACDLALAGGVSINVAHRTGYRFREGSILSPDGHCRAFDARARGTVFGSGAGIVVLKRLADAVADGDAVRAVVRGSAVNNDGALKAGYTAPSVEGQAEVIAEALAAAGTPADTISYVEAHGTATELGDPIEIQALTRAFRKDTDKKGFCALGSVKSNLGHLDVAAGAAGLIKTVLALEHRQIPPSLHFEEPNPKIDFASSPVYVATELREWRSEGGPRRAGVSSFGIGGTNAHVVVEEAPAVEEPGASRPWQLLSLSAKTRAALDRAAADLAARLRRRGAAGPCLADVAYTLAVGRETFGHRRIAVCRDAEDAAGVLEGSDPERLLTRRGRREPWPRPVAFLFPGQGAQYVGMGRELYEREPIFRDAVDRGSSRLEPLLGFDLRRVLYPPPGEEEAARERLAPTAVTQPALFVVEHAMAELWRAWGIEPEAMIGHSIGEYVAACLAGVFSYDDALAVVAARGRLMQEMPPGAMWSVPLPADEVRPLLGEELALAAANAPSLCSVAGPAAAVEAFAGRLAERGVESRRLHTSHAFHSAMMEPILERFTAELEKVELRPPRIPYLSNLTGTWATADDATDPDCWARHLRHTVRFADGLAELAREGERVLLEVGPGRTLSGLARHLPLTAVPSMRHPRDAGASDLAVALTALGRLWLAGRRIDWPRFFAGQRRRRVPLPTYSFERRSYWIGPGKPGTAAVEPERPGELHDRPELETEYVAPRDEIESRLAGFWQDLLGVGKVGVHDNFFALGGHSLLATQILSRARESFQVELTIEHLFERPTVAGLARRIASSLPSGKTSGAAAPPLLPLPREAREAGLPLSFAQERLWFLDRLMPGTATYNLPAAVRVAGALDAAALARGLGEIVRRHETLRTTFAETEGRVVQVVAPAVRTTLPVADLRRLPRAAREAEAERLAVREARRPFDLARGPLLRVTLVRLDERLRLLLVTFHHVVADNWSIGVFIREIGALYEAFAGGAAAPQDVLPRPSVQYADYAHWQRRRIEGEVLESQLAYWRRQLAGAPRTLELPTDRPRPPIQTFRGGRRSFRLPRELSAELRSLARRHEATPFMTLLAAFGVLLHRYAGQRELAVGSPIAGRNHREIEGLIGFFVNTLVLRLDLAGDPPFRELLGRVRRTALGAFDHQDLPFEKVVAELQPERDLSRSPFFQVMFVLREAPLESLELPGLTLEPVEPHTGTASFDLLLAVEDSGEGLQGSLEHNLDLFDGTTAERWARNFGNLLRGAAARPEERASRLPLMSGAEAHQLSREWQGAPGPAPHLGERCLHRRIEAQVERTPEAVALSRQGRDLSYREVNRRANLLGRRLRGLGVGPEALVGVAAQRSPEMVVALLAILKAGGAYVPLDPAYPRERTAFMLEDAAVAVLLTDEHVPAPDGRPRVLAFDALRDGGEPAADLPGGAGPEHLAYVIYTSGSTGRAKGVAISHRSAAVLLDWAAEEFSPRRLAGVLASTSICFDLSVFELFVPLSVGGRAILARDALELPALAAAGAVTLINTVPSAMAELLRSGGVPASVTTVNLAGEPLPAALVREIHRRSDAEVFDLYGPSEDTTYSTYARMAKGATGAPSIGRPIDGTEARLVDPRLRPVPLGAVGELVLGGAGLARGYFGRPRATAERFVPHPWSREAGGRLYRTGDLARHRSGGDLDFLGRADHQVKLRGFRIELGEIEAVLGRHPAVEEAVAAVRPGAGDEPRLVAYVVCREGATAAMAELRDFLRRKLPEYMVPSAFAQLAALPRHPNGKVDRRSLPAPESTGLESPAAPAPPASELEKTLAAVWCRVLGRQEVGIHHNFFDLGGHSLLVARLVSELRGVGERELSVVDVFEHPTVASLARYLSGEKALAPAVASRANGDGAIAVVGLAGRFPGARDVDRFWRNLAAGVESISRFTLEELAAAGVDAQTASRPDYVPAHAVLADADLFDADFFGLPPREAQLTDPQRRIFLETAWETLEDAGCNPRRFPGRIGVFAGVSLSTYLVRHLLSHPAVEETASPFEIYLANDKDFLPTQTSYRLDLHGPSLSVGTACSTSLVAVHLACRSLRDGECDAALAGGVTVTFPQRAGYLYQAGGIQSPDGRCRPFDAAAAGTVFGDGAGAVLLKRLEDALAAGDSIRAVIRGSALNNDGSRKVGFTAPSVEFQAAVIAEAQRAAGVDPETVTYVETHGTATALGDPIEVRALNRAFAGTGRRGFCALGSVKSNVGHLDTAAGIAGLIKTVLALEHRQIPPSLHFATPNPEIDFAASPFYVNTALRDWEPPGLPRRAGVSAFGIGGTNAHVVLEEAPAAEPSGPSRPWQLLLLSARTPAALEEATGRLAAHLRQHPELDLADVAYTLHVGRRGFKARRTLVCRDREDALRALADEPRRRRDGVRESGRPQVAFLFPGQGSQHVGMGAELYRAEPRFRDEVDRCCDVLAPHLGLDLRTVLYPPPEEAAEAAARLQQTALAQPALFTVEYALASLWAEWGVRPEAMLGHSIGEYVAACLAGVLSLEPALALVALRGLLIQQLPAGAMLSVALPPAEVEPRLAAGVALAAVNGRRQCVVSGTAEAIADLEKRWRAEEVRCRRLHTSHAFHSPLMEPALGAFGEAVKKVELRPPRIPFASNLTGSWITPDEATDPRYWVQHLRETVRFADGLDELRREPRRALLEVGPGTALSSLAGDSVIASLPHPRDRRSEQAVLLTAAGRLWLAGVELDGAGLYARQRRRRVRLPTYPFARRRFWIEPSAKAGPLARRADVADWFYFPSWKRSAGPPASAAVEKRSWVVFVDELGVGAALAEKLEEQGHDVVRVAPGEGFSRRDDGVFTVGRRREDYAALFEELHSAHRKTDVIVHLWTVTPAAASSSFEEMLELGFHSLIRLAQALGPAGGPVRIEVISNHLHEVVGGEATPPEKATVLGPCKVIPREYPGFKCRSIDVGDGGPGEPLAARILGEIGSPPAETEVAYRGPYRWVRTFEKRRLEGADPAARLRQGGVYLITGGLGGLGSLVAEYLVQTAGARLILVSRTELPPRHEWRRRLDGGEDPVRRKIERLRRLEELGAEVMVCAADVADRGEMGEVLARARRRFGAIHGVIHAAGVAGGGLIQLETPREATRVMRPKALGLLSLDALLREAELDFLVLFSSFSAVAGEVGQVGYCAANLFLDAFAEHRSYRGGTAVMAIDWGTWREVGLAVDAEVPDEVRPIHDQALRHGISNHEGQEAFGRILAHGAGPRVIVSTRDLEASLEQLPELTPAPAPAVTRHSRPSLETAYATPRNETERALAELWQEVFGLEQVGRDDSFFELGGHSLLALQLLSRVRDRWGVELGVERLFAAATVAGLAREIERERAGADAAPAAESFPAPPIVPAPRPPEVPCSFAQQRLWFLDQLEPGSASYNVPLAVRLAGRLDAAALERSLSAVVARHESLRTTFAAAEDHPLQVVGPPRVVPIPRVELTALAAPRRREESRRWLLEEARRPFDLSRGPLLRALLLRLAGDEHLLALSIHHIVSDGWSIGVLMREVGAHYGALARGESAEAPPLPVQYADFALWQRRWLESPHGVAELSVMESQLAYWRRQLAGAPANLELPADRPRPPLWSGAGATRPLLAPEAVSAAVLALARQREVTPFMVLLAAFQTLLHRYSGQEDVVVGSPIAGRRRPEVEGLIGFFVNNLVLRGDLAGAPSFAVLLDRARRVTLAAYAHQDVPFEHLVETLEPRRDRGRTPLFQVALVLQNTPVEKLELPDLTLTRVATDSRTAKFDLTFMFWQEIEGPLEGRLAGSVEYATDLFDETTVARMTLHFFLVLESAAARPRERISSLELVSPAERHQLLGEWNATATDYPRDECVHRVFAGQAARRPDAVALACGDGRPPAQQLSYRELDRRANRLARHLRGRGVGPDVLVPVLLDRRAELVVGILGTLKAGGAYLPLDPGTPAQRLALLLEESRAPVALTEAGLAAALPPAARALRLDSEAGAAAGSDADPGAAVRADNLCYVMFTSGTTGRPKGVGVPHRAVLRLVRGAGYAELGPREVFLQLASVSFDAATLEIWGPLAHGGRLVLVAGRAPSLEQLAEWLVRERISTLWLTAGLFHHMAETHPRSLAGLRQLLAGGDVLSPPHVRALLPELPRTRLINGYGPTENTTFTCCATLTGRPETGASVPIGRPVAGTRIHLLDGRLQPVPIGVAGMLWTGGDGLARGYYRRPAATAAAFAPDPLAAEPGGRLYRTGDRARHLADGNVEFLGRVDGQVKIRGFRIEPGEIEAVLARHPAVAQAVVVARPAPAGEDVPGAKRLVAYFVPAAGEAPGARELRRHLGEALPRYMVPSAFVSMEAFPLTANGKVDRKALPAPDLRPEAERRVAPRTPVEEMLAGIWSQVLGVEGIGAEDDFFALGGHSLLATRVVSRLRAAFGVTLSLGQLFEAPGLAALAALVEAARRREAEPALPPLRPAAEEEPAPLSFAQQRLWYLSQIEPGSAEYNVPAAVDVSGPLDVAALHRGLAEIVRRHEVLRTRFAEASGRAVQLVEAAFVPELPVVDLGALSADRRRTELARWAAEEAQRPFDLARGPLLRATLAALGPERHVFFLHQHHIVSDGWSVGILIGEMGRLYRSFAAGRPARLPPPEVQYSDFARWQRRWPDEFLQAQLAYWKERLAGLPAALDLPADRPRPAVRSARGAERPVDLPAPLVRSLEALGRRHGATLFMTLLAAFETLLYRSTGQHDFAVGSPVAGRRWPEVEGTIGFFVNMLVLRSDVAGRPSFRALLGRVRETVLAAYDHQDLPFELLVEELQPRRDRSRTPLFQVAFALQNAPAAALELPGLTLTPLELGSATAKFDLTVNLAPEGDGLRGLVEHAADLFDATTVTRLARGFEALLESIAARPEEEISTLELLRPSERWQVLEEWNATAAPRLRAPGVHLLFEDRAAAAPDALAVASGRRRLTYRELDRRAGRLGRRLVRLGVRPEVPVAVFLERSPGMVVGILGILKAGGAYLPLDPSSPRARLAFVIEDAGVPVLVTREGLAPRLPASAAHRICLDAAAPEEEGPEPPGAAAGSGNLAYVIYTSGSTGNPKGVQVAHASLRNLVAWHLRTYRVTPESRATLVAGPAFDASVWELWPHLAAGASLHVADGATVASPPNLVRWLAAARITHCFLPTPLAEAVLSQTWPRGSTLRELLTGGDELHRGAPGPAPFRLVNHYGPTEATVVATSAAVAVAGEGPAPPPIGRPLANARVHLLGPSLEPMPLGAAGELAIGGAGVARGYHARRGLTAERFIPDRFGGAPGGRLYKTGDLARYRADGRLEFLGRIDAQVKVRGFRIELGEIETLLGTHPAVAAAAVAARGDGDGRRLVAYLVAHGELETRELRRYLQGRLPEYMVPSTFVELAALPLNPSGKVDRRALPEPAAGRSGLEAGYVAPRDVVEEALAGIWAEALGVPRLGVDDDFFELGGHSLLATRLISRIRQAFRVELPVARLFDATTVAAMARLLTETEPRPGHTEKVARVLQRVRGMAAEDVRRSLDEKRLEVVAHG